MAYQLKFPTSGSMSFSDVATKLGRALNLRMVCARIGLGAPDNFPNDFYGKRYLGFSSSNAVKPAGANSFNLTFIAYGNWSLSDNRSWITINNTSGTASGSTSVTVSLTANGSSARTGTITLSCNGYSVTYDFTQTASSLSLYAITLSRANRSGDACVAFTSGNTSTYYIDTNSLSTAAAIYSNSSGTTPAPSGDYSNGQISKDWDGVSFALSTHTCA